VCPRLEKLTRPADRSGLEEREHAVTSGNKSEPRCSCDHGEGRLDVFVRDERRGCMRWRGRCAVSRSTFREQALVHGPLSHVQEHSAGKRFGQLILYYSNVYL